MSDTTPARLQSLQSDIGRIRDGLTALEWRFFDIARDLERDVVDHYGLGHCAGHVSSAVCSLTAMMGGVRTILEKDLGVQDETRVGEEKRDE